MRIVFYFSVLLSLASNSIQCEDGWRQSAFDPNKCYFIGASEKIWFDAAIFCQAAGPNAHLTSVNSAYEANDIAAITSNTPNASMCDSFWIGGNDFDQNGQYVWSDGKPMNYRNWAPGQPDLMNHCVSSLVQTNGQWKTENCGTDNCFICENYSGALTTPATQPATQPTTNPNFLLNMDLVIAIDGSRSMPNTSFLEVITFIKTLVIPTYFNGIGQGTPGVRIALIVVPGGNGFLLPAAALQTITSRISLMQQLDWLYDEFYDGSDGQLLNSLLSEVVDNDFMSAGYRPPPATNNHLILYITGTSTATDAGNAVALAQSIRASNTYGIIAIAYTAEGQPPINQQFLMNIAGANCFMQANNVDQLTQNGLDFVRQRMISASTTGTYC